MTAKKPRKSAADAAKLVFPDVGLHLAVLGALLDAGVVDAEQIEGKLEAVDGDDEDGNLERAMKLLHKLKLDRAAVAGIESLDFDGGNEVYMLLEQGAGTATGGETDAYSLRSLAGVAALTSLRRLDLDGHGYAPEGLDLRPLADHPALETLVLSGDCTHAATLERLPKLTHLDLRLGSLDDEAVLPRLAARGVQVLR